jgi:RimJ/RimL family protein N-acetyltransferase
MMFARTARLTLRPAWPEDAPQLAAAIGHESVTRNLSKVPWPYSLADAEAHIARPRQPKDVFCLIFDHEAAQPRLIGGIGMGKDHTLFSLVEGRVRFHEGKLGRKFCSVDAIMAAAE